MENAKRCIVPASALALLLIVVTFPTIMPRAHASTPVEGALLADLGPLTGLNGMSSACGGGCVGVGFDGAFLYWLDFNAATLHKITASGSAVSDIPISGCMPTVISFDAGRTKFWAAQGTNIYLVDASRSPAQCTLQFSVAGNLPGDCGISTGCLSRGPVDGVNFDGSDDSVWYSPDGSLIVYHFSTAGALLGSFRVDVPPNDMAPQCGFNWNSGVAVGAANIMYLSADGCQTIFKYDKSGHKLGFFVPFASTRNEDMECDNVTFSSQNTDAIWVRDALSGHIRAFAVTRGTCAFGGGATFSLSASPDSITVLRGASAAFTITVSFGTAPPLNVTLSIVTGLPSGATVSFGPNPVNGTGASTLQISTSPTGGLGDFNITIQGLAGGMFRDTILYLHVYDFKVSVAPSNQQNTCPASFPLCSSVYLQNWESGSQGWFSKNGPSDPVTIVSVPNPPSPPMAQEISRLDSVGNYFSPLIPVTPGTTYLVSAWVDWVGGGQPFIGVQGFSSSSTLLWGSTVCWLIGSENYPTVCFANGITPIPALDGWHWYGQNVTIPQGTSFLRITDELYAGGPFRPGPTISYFDDIAIGLPTTPLQSPVPAPASGETLLRGSSTYLNVTVDLLDGSSKVGLPSISLAVSGLPSDAVSTLSATSGKPGFTASLKLTPGSSSLGDFTLTVNGTDSRTREGGFRTGEITIHTYDFTLTVSSAPTVLRGGSTSFNIIVSLDAGSSTIGLPPIGLSATGLVGGVANSFTVWSSLPPFSSTLVLSTNATAPLGDLQFNVIGSDARTLQGGSRSSAPVLHVYDFTVTVSPATLFVNPGGIANYTITVALVPGSTNTLPPVSLSATGLPSVETLTFNPSSSKTPTFTVTLRVQTAPDLSPRSYDLTITGTDPCSSCGGSRNTSAKLVVVPKTTITDPQFCGFDSDPSIAGQQFHLTFTGDPVTIPIVYALRTSDPSQFYYSIFYPATPSTPVTLSVEIPYPFVTQGVAPVQVHSDATLTFPSSASDCILPSGSDLTQSFGLTATFATLANYTSSSFGQTFNITASGRVPSSGLIYLTIHLDYGLIGTSGYKENPADGSALGTGTIFNGTAYIFAAGGNLTSGITIESENSFKLNPPVWPAPSSLTTSDIGPTSLTLNWLAALDTAGAVDYRIFQGSALLATVPETVHSYTVRGLSPDVTYTFKIEAVDVAGNASLDGPSTTATTLTTTEPNPTPSTTSPTPWWQQYWYFIAIGLALLITPVLLWKTLGRRKSRVPTN